MRELEMDERGSLSRVERAERVDGEMGGVGRVEVERGRSERIRNG